MSSKSQKPLPVSQLGSSHQSAAATQSPVLSQGTGMHSSQDSSALSTQTLSQAMAQQKTSWPQTSAMHP